MHKSIQRILLSFLLVAVAFEPAVAEAPAPANDELIALLSDEYTSMRELLVRLSLIEQNLAERDDRRAVFAAMYRIVTESAVQGIEEGFFEDGEWTGRLLVTFSNLYREALLNYELGRRDRVPDVWLIAFDAKDNDRVTVFQLAVLGMHAHMNRDLPLAIAQVTRNDARAARYADFYLTNMFFVTTIEDVENAIAQYDPELGQLDDMLSDFDEYLLTRVLTNWRFRAWRRAAYFDGSRSVGEERFYRWLLDLTTAYTARRIRDG